MQLQHAAAFCMSNTRILIVCVLFLTACGSKPVDLEELFGQWVVNDVYCGSCSSLDKSDIGTKISLLSDRVDNPLAGGSCLGLTGYRVIPRENNGRTGEFDKLNSSWLTGNGNIEFLSATCDSMNFMLFAVLGDGSLVYMPEGEIVFRLVKLSQNPNTATDAPRL